MGKVDNKKVGAIGERVAEEFLWKKGYRILERNWGSKYGEIDIIAKQEFTNLRVNELREGVLVFVEVKTKIGERFGTPEEMVNKRKLEKIQRMAEVYILSRPPSLRSFGEARIDVVAVVLGGDLSVERVDHYEGVY